MDETVTGTNIAFKIQSL